MTDHLGLFSVIVMVAASLASPVDTVQVYLNFDRTKLQVTEMSGAVELEVELQAGAYDNLLGQTKYAAGTLGPPRNAEFILMTVGFRALGPTGAGGTMVQFAPLAAPRHTKAIRSGHNRTGTLTNVTVVVNP